MNIYLLTQKISSGWDTYDSAVVIAENEEQAKYIHPSGADHEWWVTTDDAINFSLMEWALPQDVKVELRGTITTDEKPGVVCASFNSSG